MLPPKHRLKRLSSFAQLRQHAHPIHHPLFLLLVAPQPEASSINENEPLTQFGFAASRRVGSAVKRNRAKRQLRGVVRQRLSEIAPGWLCLFVIRQRMTSATATEIETAVWQTLHKAKVWSATEPSKDTL